MCDGGAIDEVSSNQNLFGQHLERFLLTQLVAFTLWDIFTAENQLSGSLPSELGQLTTIEYLDFRT
jgi:hypothetical protein